MGRQTCLVAALTGTATGCGPAWRTFGEGKTGVTFTLSDEDRETT